MNFDNLTALENQLSERGYKKITSCKSQERDDYEWCKAFRYKNGDLKYQIFFQFWDFTKYGCDHWGLSVCIIPESCKDYVGRRDLELSTDWADDVEKVEKVAEGFYKFIRKADKY